MGRPAELGFRMMGYVVKNILAGKKRFPVVTMLEPLETCNLTCKGCGRIREYEESVIKKKKILSVEECLAAVEESGAPIVSIAGGEPLIHPNIYEIVQKIIERKRFVYLCTNGLLMERAFKKLKPSKYFCFVVHLDGMEKVHDYWVEREGVWNVAMRVTKKALQLGFRVCTNTTIFKDSDFGDLDQLFRTLTDMGVEGCMISAGYPYVHVPDRDIFLEREESIRSFRKILDPSKGFRLYNNPLYLDFLRGERHYPSCSAWTNPTYTPLGWRKPCYLMADEHTGSLSELMDDSIWERYGTGKDPRCASCMMHSGFEAGSVIQAIKNPRDMFALVSGLRRYGKNISSNGKNGNGRHPSDRAEGAEVNHDSPVVGAKS